jgi:hypothetical protein
MSCMSRLLRGHLLSLYLSINPLKTSGNYMYHLLYQLVTVRFVFMGLVWFSF